MGQLLTKQPLVTLSSLMPDLFQKVVKRTLRLTQRSAHSQKKCWNFKMIFPTPLRSVPDQLAWTSSYDRLFLTFESCLSLKEFLPQMRPSSPSFTFSVFSSPIWLDNSSQALHSNQASRRGISCARSAPMWLARPASRPTWSETTLFHLHPTHLYPRPCSR